MFDLDWQVGPWKWEFLVAPSETMVLLCPDRTATIQHKDVSGKNHTSYLLRDLLIPELLIFL